MTTFRWNSMQELIAIQEMMNRLFEEVLYRREFPEGADERAASRWAPAADAFESAREYVFRVEIPGVSLADVKLEVEEATLRLSGTRPEVDPASRFLRMERVYGDFDREFAIPKDIDADRISASLANGILTIRAPKKGARPAKE
jgi:HSP20 family protein